MPPARTGVAAYSEALVRALRSHCEIAVNPAGDCDVDLYNIGNNLLHRPIYERALARPGWVLLHDAVLQHYFLGLGDKAAYVGEFVYNYGEWHRGTAERLWDGRAASDGDPAYFRWPMLRRIVGKSHGVIVHNPGAGRAVEEHGGRRVMELPHLFEAPGEPFGVVELRQRWGLGPDAFLFGVFGHLRQSKRLATSLRVFERLRRRDHRLWLLVAGQFVSPDLERALPLDGPGIIRIPYLAENDFWRHAYAVDACINLRYPTAGETSGILIRLMGIGKPVIVTAGEEVTRMAEPSCLRVDPGSAEEEMLAAYMLWLSAHPVQARRIGRAAAEHIRAHHAPRLVASMLCSRIADPVLA